MTRKSEFVFENGEPINVGSHGKNEYVFASGNEVTDSGKSALVYESGNGLGSRAGLIIDSFEDGNIDEYRGYRNEFSVRTDSDLATDGDRYLEGEAKRASTYQIMSTSGLNAYPRRGDIFRANLRFDFENEQLIFLFGCQGNNRGDNAYGLQALMQNNELVLGVGNNEDPADDTTIDRTSVDYSGYAFEWLTWEVQWNDPTIIGRLYETDADGEPLGGPIATVSGDDTSYDSGGVGWVVDAVGAGRIKGQFDYAKLVAESGTGPINKRNEFLGDVFNTGYYPNMSSVTSSPSVAWTASQMPSGDAYRGQPIDDTNSVYIGTGQGIFKVDKGTGELVASNTSYNHNYGEIMLVPQSNEVWATGDNVVVYDDSLDIVYSYSNYSRFMSLVDSRSDPLRAVLGNNSGALQLVSWSGQDDHPWTAEWYQSTGDDIGRFCVKFGTIWASTFDRGLQLIDVSDGSKIKTYSTTYADQSGVCSIPSEDSSNGDYFFAADSDNLGGYSESSKRWDTDVEAFQGQLTPVSDGTNVYIVGDDALLAYDVDDGSQTWSNGTIGSTVNIGAAVTDDTVYFVTSNDTLHAFDTSDGSERWQYGAIQSSNVVLPGDGCVYAANTDGKLIKLE